MISAEIRKDLMLVLWTLEGEVQATDIITRTADLIESGQQTDAYNVLSDCRPLTTVFSPDEVEYFRQSCRTLYSRFSRKIKCASVYRQEVQYGMARVFDGKVASDKVLSETFSFAPFYSMAEAKRWLGIEKDTSIL